MPNKIHQCSTITHSTIYDNTTSGCVHTATPLAKSIYKYIDVCMNSYTTASLKESNLAEVKGVFLFYFQLVIFHINVADHPYIDDCLQPVLSPLIQQHRQGNKSVFLSFTCCEVDIFEEKVSMILTDTPCL